MIETELPLDTSVDGILDANGAATTYVGPTYANERWVVNLMSARGSATAKLEVFRGNSMTRLDATERADIATSNTDIDLRNGDRLRFQWTNGTAGVIMSCSIQGVRYLKGQRGY